MNTDQSWYVLYTKPKWEKKVAEILSNKGVEIYCPLNKVVRQWHDRKKTVQEPLFPSYVFVRTSAAQHSYIKEASGVINFVYWLGKPAVVKKEEIVAIQTFLSEYQNVHIEKADVSPNDRVRIVQGPLMNQEGNVIEVFNRKVKVSLPSLGYLLVAEVSRTNIELLESYKEVIPLKNWAV